MHTIFRENPSLQKAKQRKSIYLTSVLFMAIISYMKDSQRMENLFLYKLSSMNRGNPSWKITIRILSKKKALFFVFLSVLILMNEKTLAIIEFRKKECIEIEK